MGIIAASEGCWVLDEERRVAASVAQRPVPAHDLERKDVGRRARASHRLLGRGDRHLRGCRRTWHWSEVLEADPLGDIIWRLLQDVGDDSQQLGSVLAVQQPVFDLCTPRFRVSGLYRRGREGRRSTCTSQEDVRVHPERGEGVGKAAVQQEREREWERERGERYLWFGADILGWVEVSDVYVQRTRFEGDG